MKYPTLDEKYEWFYQHDNKWQNDMIAEFMKDGMSETDLIKEVYKLYH